MRSRSPCFIYIHAGEIYISFSLACMFFIYISVSKIGGMRGNGGTLKAEACPFLQFALFQVRSSCF